MSNQRFTDEARAWLVDWCAGVELVADWGDGELDRGWTVDDMRRLEDLGVDTDNLDVGDETWQALDGMILDATIVGHCAARDVHDDDWIFDTLDLVVTCGGPTIVVSINIRNPGQIESEHSQLGTARLHNPRVAETFLNLAGIDL